MKKHKTMPLMAFLLAMVLSGGFTSASAQTTPTTPTNAETRATNTATNQAQRAADTARLNAEAAAQRTVNTTGNAAERSLNTSVNQAQRAVTAAEREQLLNEARETEDDKRGDRALRRDAQMILNRTVTTVIVDTAKAQNRQQALDERFDAWMDQTERDNQFRQQNRQQDAQDRLDAQADDQINLETRTQNRDAYQQDAEQRHQAEQEGLRSRGGGRAIDPNNATLSDPGANAVAADTLGGVVDNFGRNLVRFPSLFYIMSYVCGVFFLAMSLSKANKAVLNPSQNPVADAVKYAMAGVFLMSLPMTTDVIHDSLGFQGGNIDLNYAQGLSKAKELNGGAMGLDSFIINLVTDITGPVLKVVSLFGFVAGVFLIFSGLKRLVKGSQEGPKGPAGLGTIMTFVVGAALISFVPSLQVFLSTLFGTDTVMTFPAMTNVSSSLGLDTAAIAHSQAVFTSLLAFLGIIGVISFARGLFMMKDVADGAQNASLMGSMSHMIAGVCCVNFGAVANLLQNTLGLANLGVTFQ